MATEIFDSLERLLQRGELNAAANVYLAIRPSLRAFDLAMLRKRLPRQNHIGLLRKLYFQHTVDNQRFHAENILEDFLSLNPDAEEKTNFEGVITTPDFFRAALDAFKTKAQQFDEKSIDQKSKDELESEKKTVAFAVTGLGEMDKRITAKLAQLSEQEKYYSVETLRSVFQELQKEIIEQKNGFLARWRILQKVKDNVVVPQPPKVQLQQPPIQREPLLPPKPLIQPVPVQPLPDNDVVSQDAQPTKTKIKIRMSFLNRYALRKSLEEALREDRLTDVVAIDYHFRNLIADESPRDREVKSRAFRSVLLKDARYLEILKAEFSLASEESNQRVVSEIGLELSRLLDRETFAKLIMELQSSHHLNKQLNVYEKRAAVLRNMAWDQKNDDALREEKEVLGSLIGFLDGLKTKVSEKKDKPTGSRFVKKKQGLAGLPLSPGMQIERPPRVIIESKLEQDLGKKINFHSARSAVLDNVIAKRHITEASENQKRERVSSFCANRAHRKKFHAALDAIPPKRFQLFFGASRKAFDAKKFITLLTEINDGATRQNDDPSKKNEIFFQALLTFFRQLSSFKLKRLIEDLNHPTFKNFFFAFDYYADIPENSNATNIVHLFKGLKTDGVEEQRPLAALQTLTSTFIAAFHEALIEHDIDFVNYFQTSPIKQHEDVHKANQGFIWEYVMNNSGKNILDRQEGDEWFEVPLVSPRAF
ncbi:MAG TPA: hypothetical protein VGV92_01440 [Gammaproteobacteria bacterium]|nr:hypothetical protein [Gammaproteobacteria bacterium]